MSSIGVFWAKSKLACPYPEVVTRIPLLAPSFCKVPNRSRTADTPTVFLYRLAWMTTLAAENRAGIPGDAVDAAVA